APGTLLRAFSNLAAFVPELVRGRADHTSAVPGTRADAVFCALHVANPAHSATLWPRFFASETMPRIECSATSLPEPARSPSVRINPVGIQIGRARHVARCVGPEH